MAAADRLSALPDDLLQHILSFAPAREAASSSLLSRRWRPLWRQTSAVNLDSRPYADTKAVCYDRPTFDAFFRVALATLAAFHPRRGGRAGTGGLKRLTLSLDQGVYHRANPYYWMDDDEHEEGDDRVAGILLADPAAAGLEELRVENKRSHFPKHGPRLASLPCAATLRVLELARCNLEPLSSAAPSACLDFPRLSDLRLRACVVSEGYLQVLVDAAPTLTSLVLVHVTHRAAEPAGSAKKPYYMSTCFRLPLRLRCRTVAALELEAHASQEELEDSANGGRGIELDMPSLRSFRYWGYPVKLSMASPAPGLALVDLDASRHEFHVRKYEPTSRMLTGFSSTRVLKLRVKCIEDIVAGEKEHGGPILPTFPNLELLELDGHYEYMNSCTAVAMARLLRSCPAMSEFRLRLKMQWDYRYRSKKGSVGGPFGDSMDRFKRLAYMSSTQREIVEFREISELAALSNNCVFSCLRTSLRKVTLQFKAKEMNCFPVQLAKFLVENAMVLEEMHVDDGSQFWPDHLRHNVARWRADAFRRRNLKDTAGFQVCQLANTVEDSDGHIGYD